MIDQLKHRHLLLDGIATWAKRLLWIRQSTPESQTIEDLGEAKPELLT